MPSYLLSQHASVVNVLLGQQDGEATYRRLRAGVDSGGLTPEERLDLVFLPLMRHQRARQEVVADALGLAQRLPEQQQQEAMAALFGLGHQFLTGAEMDALLEGLMSTSIGQRLIERGIERGIDRGIVQGRRQDILLVLTRRFGPLPAALAEQIAQIDDAERLETILGAAATATSLDEFTQTL